MLKTHEMHATPETLRFAVNAIRNCIETTCLRMMPDGYMVDLRDNDRDLKTLSGRASKFEALVLKGKVTGAVANKFWEWLFKKTGDMSPKTKIGVLKRQLFGDAAEIVRLLYL